MAIEIVDHIPAHTVEVGDLINLEVEGNFTVTDISDHGSQLQFTGIDEYDDEITITINPDVIVPLLMDVSNDDEEI